MKMGMEMHAAIDAVNRSVGLEVEPTVAVTTEAVSNDRSIAQLEAMMKGLA
jgi:hypothetical protein